jgi:hypothetical protein
MTNLAVALIAAAAATIPTPEPGVFPRGRANATLFENLPLVRELEARSGRGAVLVFMDGTATTDGRLHSGSSWSYHFGYGTNPYRVISWTVDPAGDVRYAGEEVVLRKTSRREISAAAYADTPEVARLALSHGGDAYVARFSEAALRVGYRFRFGVPEAQVHLASPQANGCEIDVFVNFDTRALLGSEMSCLPPAGNDPARPTAR